MKLVVTLLTAVLATSAFAKSIVLVDIYNQEDTDLIEFTITVDPANDQRIIDLSQVYYKKGASKPYLVEKFTVKDVKSKGAVLSSEGKHKVVVMKALSADEMTGGKLVLDYLYNGIWGTREDKFMFLSRDKFNNWMVSFDGKTKLTNMCFHSNKSLGKTIGVKKITSGKCPR